MTSKEWLEKAKKEKFALGAFNVGNLETFRAIAQAAANKKSPVIIESSAGETEWMGADNIVDLAKNFSQDFGVPILVNLDHAGSLEECLRAVEAGYDLIHFDGSKLPYAENVSIAQKVVEMAHLKGCLVEGELDHISGSSQVHQGTAQAEVLTRPEKAKQFVEETGIDILAVSIGNVHGVFSQGGENLQMEILEELQKVLPKTFFALHGGSGIAAEQVRSAVQKGVVKVNVNTELRRVFRDDLMQVLAKNPEEYAMYKIEKPVVEDVQKIVEQKMDIFGSWGKI